VDKYPNLGAEKSELWLTFQKLDSDLVSCSGHVDFFESQISEDNNFAL